MKIAVVGAGIFGCMAALKLQEAEFQVTLYEEKNEIMKCASKVNQYRLHLGYHYPRSFDTAISSAHGVHSFTKEFSSILDPEWYEHYYAISAENSSVDAFEYLKFLIDSRLEFKIIGDADWIDCKKIQLLIKVPERTIDIFALRGILQRRIEESGIDLKLNQKFAPEKTDEYDIVINATYSNINYLLDESDRVDYQFEVIEKPVVDLPKEWDKRSLVVLDGPFFCIDKYFKMNCHVMGHVQHAILHTNVGHFPEIPKSIQGYLNSTIICRRQYTNFDLFVESAHEFLPNTTINTIGSMYTIRTVLPNRDHDDARPSYITKHSDKLYSIFSGKIGTCVDIANELVQLIRG